jgi:2-polyprenyl-3-methyl-5-hydroxy-6-metoxy-1,4-benzoquinol methylase
MGLAGYDENYTYDFDHRPEIAPFVPTSAKRVLDVGCDQGGFAQTLRSVLPDVELVGIDPVAASVRAAEQSYDRVLHGLFPDVLDDKMPGESFDCIFFLDVLEHMTDPWSTLAESRRYLGPGGRVVASIPNIRHFPVAVSLLFRGRFEYGDNGVLDRTHLRFFTKRTMVSMFENAGFRIERIQGLRPFPTQRRHAPFRLLRPLMRDAKYRQFVIVATPV